MKKITDGRSTRLISRLSFVFPAARKFKNLISSLYISFNILLAHFHFITRVKMMEVWNKLYVSLFFPSVDKKGQGIVRDDIVLLILEFVFLAFSFLCSLD